jgi:hypothetical protein
MVQIARRAVLRAFVFCLAAVACHPKASDSEARTRLARILRDSLGQSSDPNVAFITEGDRRDSHLYVMFDTTAIPNVSDSVFERRARDLARFAVRHYDEASKLDSVTVATRESVQRGVWKIRHSRAFAVAGLNESGAP